MYWNFIFCTVIMMFYWIDSQKSRKASIFGQFHCIALSIQPKQCLPYLFSISCLPYLSLASDSNHFFPAKCANNTSSAVMHDSEFQLTVFLSLVKLFSNLNDKWLNCWVVKVTKRIMRVFCTRIFGFQRSLHVVEEPDLKEVVKSAHTALDSIGLSLFVLYELVEFDKDWTGKK